MTNPTFFRIFCATIFWLLCEVNAWACFNEYAFHGSNGGNGSHDIHGFEKLPNRHFTQLHIPDSVCATYKDSSDFAVYLLKQGYVGRGLQLLVRLSKIYPREYVIAANLGTAFELAGQNDSALRWIEYSLRLNPKAHEGTEWVHLDVLKAKIELANDPEWLDKNHVLNISRSGFGNDIMGSKPIHTKLHGYLRAIYIQLTERLPFTSPGDMIMGDICADAAQIIEATSIEVGMAWWKLAEEFGVPASCPDPRQRILKLIETGNNVPFVGEQVPVRIKDSVNPEVTMRTYQISYLSFAKFNPAKAWKLRDESLLSQVLKELRLHRIPATVKPDAKEITLQQEVGIPLWVWVSVASGVLLVAAIFYFRSKSKI